MKTDTTRLGMLGALLASLVIMPATSALGRDRGDHGRDGGKGHAAAPARRDDHRGPVYRRDDRGRIIFQIGPSLSAVSRRYIPGHYETRTEQVLVEDGHYEIRTEQVLVEQGRWEDRYVPAVTEARHDWRGWTYTVIVSPARMERVWIPPRYDIRTVRVWCPPRYELRTVQVWVPGCYVTEPAPPRPLISLQGIFRW